VGWACNMHRCEKCVQDNLKGRGHLENLGMDEIILE